jgi:hypothetical protein
MPTVKNSVSKTKSDKAIVNTININVDSIDERKKKKEKKKKKLAKAYGRGGGYGGIRGGRGRGPYASNVPYPQYPQPPPKATDDATSKQIAEILQKQFDEKYAEKENEKAKAKQSPFQSPGAFNAVDGGRGFSVETNLLLKPNDNYRRVNIGDTNNQTPLANPLYDQLRQSYYQTDAEPVKDNNVFEGEAVAAKPFKEKQYCSICKSWAVDLKAHNRTKKHKTNLAKLNNEEQREVEKSSDANRNLLPEQAPSEQTLFNQIIPEEQPIKQVPSSLKKSQKFEEAMKELERNKSETDTMVNPFGTPKFDMRGIDFEQNLFSEVKNEDHPLNNALRKLNSQAQNDLRVFDEQLKPTKELFRTPAAAKQKALPELPSTRDIEDMFKNAKIYSDKEASSSDDNRNRLRGNVPDEATIQKALADLQSWENQSPSESDL